MGSLNGIELEYQILRPILYPGCPECHVESECNLICRPNGNEDQSRMIIEISQRPSTRSIFMSSLVQKLGVHLDIKTS